MPSSYYKPNIAVTVPKVIHGSSAEVGEIAERNIIFSFCLKVSYSIITFNLVIGD